MTRPRPTEEQPTGDRPSRRRVLRAGGVIGLGLALGACAADGPGGGATSTTGAPATGSTTGTTATGSSGSRGTTAPGGTAALTVADFDGLPTCRLLPEQTAGPFPLDEQFDRRDVTEGRPGQPMRLGLRVVDAACAAVPGARVEIWHCDATGDYSAFTDGGGGRDEAEGTTFLRGTQAADDDGIVEFESIVPGWYRGRAVHVHLRVHLDDRTVLTSQLYFDPDELARVYAHAPYAELGPPDTSNEDDAIAGDVVANGTLLVTSAVELAAGAGTLALLNLGIDPTATSSGSGGGPGGGGPPPGGPPGGRG